MKRRTDSVPAMLTPREAILNRNAAELLGRDAIKRLNDHGNMLAKRGVDLASDPTPGPSTENLLGYQYGTSMVQGDDRSDLLAEADNTFYGGGNAPAPTPTPTPVTRGYAYGTEDVEDKSYAPYGSGAASNKTINAFAKRYGVPNSRGNITIPTPSGGTATIGQPSGYSDDQSVPQNGVSRIPVSKSQYINQTGTAIGPQYDPATGTVNPKPSGAVGIQGFSKPTAPSFSKPMTHTEMAADIARRNLTATGSSLGTPTQKIPGIDDSTLSDQGIDPNQSMANVNMSILRNIQDNKDRQSGTYQPPTPDQGYGSAYSQVSGVNRISTSVPGQRGGYAPRGGTPGYSYGTSSGGHVDVAPRRGGELLPSDSFTPYY